MLQKFQHIDTGYFNVFWRQYYFKVTKKGKSAPQLATIMVLAIIMHAWQLRQPFSRLDFSNEFFGKLVLLVNADDILQG